jgi:hypothetical protein
MVVDCDFFTLLQIQKDLYAKKIRPCGLNSKKYFKKSIPELTLHDILIYSIDIWHIDTLHFWSTCNSAIGENDKNLNPKTLHKVLVFNRYKNILTGSLGNYLQKLKEERSQCLK